jgi:hypothetical protein
MYLNAPMTGCDRAQLDGFLQGPYIAALTSTVIFNVPVNLATGRWDPKHPPEDWK